MFFHLSVFELGTDSNTTALPETLQKLFFFFSVVHRIFFLLLNDEPQLVFKALENLFSFGQGRHVAVARVSDNDRQNVGPRGLGRYCLDLGEQTLCCYLFFGN